MVFIKTTSDSKVITEIWYLDTGFSNHVTGNKDWLLDFDPSKKTFIRCASNRTIIAEGMGNIMFKKENDQVVLIHNVFHVPGISCNLISIEQLI